MNTNHDLLMVSIVLISHIILLKWLIISFKCMFFSMTCWKQEPQLHSLQWTNQPNYFNSYPYTKTN